MKYSLRPVKPPPNAARTASSNCASSTPLLMASRSSCVPASGASVTEPRWSAAKRARLPAAESMRSDGRETRTPGRSARMRVERLLDRPSSRRSSARAARPRRSLSRRAAGRRPRRPGRPAARAPAGTTCPPGRSGSRRCSRASPRRRPGRARPRAPARPGAATGGVLEKAVNTCRRAGRSLSPGNHMPGTRGERARGAAARDGAASAATISSSRCSTSPMKKASKNGASGHGFATAGPPPSTIGCPSPRSAACSGTPARSSISSTLVYVSSCGSVKPQRSHAGDRPPCSPASRAARRRRASSAGHVGPRAVGALRRRRRGVVQVGCRGSAEPGWRCRSRTRPGRTARCAALAPGLRRRLNSPPV